LGENATLRPAVDGDTDTVVNATPDVHVDFFSDLLDEYSPREEAERRLRTAVNRERYAELFVYDASEGRLYLPDPVAGVGDESV
jgi:hypothetical protein